MSEPYFTTFGQLETGQKYRHYDNGDWFVRDGDRTNDWPDMQHQWVQALPLEEPKTLRERVDELPVNTLIKIGWRTPSGNVQGTLHLRTKDGLRYCGPARDNWEYQSLIQETGPNDSDFEIVAIPLENP
jgi:hypothetical protein